MYIVVCVIVLLCFLKLKDKVADWGVQQTRRDAKAGRGARNFLILLVGGGLLAASMRNKDSSSSGSLSSYRLRDLSSEEYPSGHLPTPADPESSDADQSSAGASDDISRETPGTPSSSPYRVNTESAPIPDQRSRTYLASPSPVVEVRRALPVNSSRHSASR